LKSRSSEKDSRVREPPERKVCVLVESVRGKRCKGLNVFYSPICAEMLDRLQQWEKLKFRERERQIQEWEERERAMEEKRRRVQAGLGLDVDEVDVEEDLTQG